MKKTLLFLCVIGVATMMTSCLDAGNRFSEPAFMYVAVAENGVIYGRVNGFNTNRITSPEIQQGFFTPAGSGTPILITPGDFFWVWYEWDEESDDFTRLGERVYAHNVRLPMLSDRLEQLRLRSTPAPEPVQRLAALEINGGFPDPVFWNDHWIISYAFYGGRDTPPTLSFYKREIPQTSVNERVTVDIDVRIEGIPQVAGTPPRGGGAVALNMADVRRELQQESNRAVIVRFHFYQRDSDTPVTITSREWQITGTTQ